MTETQLQAIEKDVATLSLHDHIKLMEVLARQLMVKSRRSENQYDWSSLYGLGKGLWDGEDAQTYVERMRGQGRS
jgi:hypothetical protein